MADTFSDSINPTTPITYAPRKKKANRSANLKQCNPNAHRERCLSLGVVKNNGSKEDLPDQQPVQCDDERKNEIENLETERSDRGSEEEKEGSWVYVDFDTSSPSNSLTDISILSSFTGSSRSSSDCFSGNSTDGEEVDDWEVVADAFVANDIDEDGDKDNNHCLESELCENSNQEGSQITEFSNLAPSNCQAWRSNDAFRPRNQNFPNVDTSLGRDATPWSCLDDAPSICPICCEELDDTDISFLPCICSFQLCLFCYHRILNQEDGRCPGCRKPYEVDAGNQS